MIIRWVSKRGRFMSFYHLIGIKMTQFCRSSILISNCTTSTCRERCTCTHNDRLRVPKFKKRLFIADQISFWSDFAGKSTLPCSLTWFWIFYNVILKLLLCSSLCSMFHLCDSILKNLFLLNFIFIVSVEYFLKGWSFNYAGSSIRHFYINNKYNFTSLSCSD